MNQRDIAISSGVVPFLAMEVTREARALARAGRDIAFLQIGEPSMPPPGKVREALARAADANGWGYTEALGMPELRAAIAAFYGRRYGIDVKSQNIAVTTGSSGAFLLSFLAAFRTGARVGLALPWYPAYPNILRACGMSPVPIRAKEECGFRILPEDMKSIGELDGLIVASPANPTGAVTAPEAMRSMAAALGRAGGTLISDEIYHGLNSVPVGTLVGAAENIIVVNSFSKYFAMPGARLGWLVAPDGLMQRIEALAQNLAISAPTLGQHAALVALDCEAELDAMAAAYASAGSRLREGLASLGLTRVVEPQGAFYLYVNVSEHSTDSMAFSRHLLHEHGVAVTPGHDFDPIEGHAWVRMSYASPPEMIEKALDRIAGMLQRGRPL